jgi:hypothetical protein
MLSVSGWAVGVGLTAFGVMAYVPFGVFPGAAFGAIGWVFGGLSWAWALSGGRSRWRVREVLTISVSWIAAFSVAAYLVWHLSNTDGIFVLLGWVLGFALGGVIGGFLTGLALRMRLLQAFSLATVTGAALGAIAYPGILVGYILSHFTARSLGKVLGPDFPVTLGMTAGAAAAGACAGLVLALPFTMARVRESFLPGDGEPS